MPSAKRLARARGSDTPSHEGSEAKDGPRPAAQGLPSEQSNTTRVRCQLARDRDQTKHLVQQRVSTDVLSTSPKSRRVCDHVFVACRAGCFRRSRTNSNRLRITTLMAFHAHVIYHPPVHIRPILQRPPSSRAAQWAVIMVHALWQRARSLQLLAALAGRAVRRSRRQPPERRSG